MNTNIKLNPVQRSSLVKGSIRKSVRLSKTNRLSMHTKSSNRSSLIENNRISNPTNILLACKQSSFRMRSRVSLNKISYIGQGTHDNKTYESINDSQYIFFK